MNKYRTEQRQQLMAFLRANADREFTAEDLAQALPDISQSAIYRNIRQMADEGNLRCFVAGHSRRHSFQYIGSSDCAAHLHLKCDHCGQIIHLDAQCMEAISTSIQSLDFVVNPGKTVLHGACKACFSR